MLTNGNYSNYVLMSFSDFWVIFGPTIISFLTEDLGSLIRLKIDAHACC